MRALSKVPRALFRRRAFVQGRKSRVLTPLSQSLSPSVPTPFVSFNARNARTFSSEAKPDFDDIVLPAFEGPEKILEAWFCADDPTVATKSLRDIPTDVWQTCLNSVNCEILNVVSNEHVTAFLLSESSMFVYDDRVFLKTCGTTTLLKVIPGLKELAQSCNLNVVEDFFYSRQNYMFPKDQVAPHRSFEEEISCLDESFKNGAAFTLGRVNGDHYNVYTAEPTGPMRKADSSLEVMMKGLDADTMRAHFYKDTFNDQTLDKSGIGGLYKGALIDEFIFEPFGYSMNGLVDDSFFTIHITPQPSQSYASFETNVPSSDYTDLLHKVVDIFKPTDFQVVTSCNDQYLENARDPAECEYATKGVEGFKTLDHTKYHFSNYQLSYLSYKR